MADERPTPAEDRREQADPEPSAAGAPVEESPKSVASDGEAPPQEDSKHDTPKHDAAQQEEPQKGKPVAYAAARSGPAGEEIREVSAHERRRINRRELLKLVPIIAIGAFAIPKLQEPLLM
ncbi:MAG: hypothetical protein WAM65_05080, partial [Candidatus Korobacteraceae bacterium]